MLYPLLPSQPPTRHALGEARMSQRSSALDRRHQRPSVWGQWTRRAWEPAGVPKPPLCPVAHVPRLPLPSLGFTRRSQPLAALHSPAPRHTAARLPAQPSPQPLSPSPAQQGDGQWGHADRCRDTDQLLGKPIADQIESDFSVYLPSSRYNRLAGEIRWREETKGEEMGRGGKG